MAVDCLGTATVQCGQFRLHRDVLDTTPVLRTFVRPIALRHFRDNYTGHHNMRHNCPDRNCIDLLHCDILVSTSSSIMAQACQRRDFRAV